MKIMYCITSSSWGGAQLHVFELCKGQIKRGNEVIFVVGSKGPLLNKIKSINGVKIILLSSLRREISPLNDIRAIFELRSLIKDERPNILHLHSSKAGTLGRLACIGLRKQTKVIFTVHGWAFTDGVPSSFKRFVYRLVERYVSSLTTLFICVSEYDKRIGLRDRVLTNKSNVVVIHNGSYKPDKNDINFSVHKPLRLVMVARFSEQKNQELLINAMSKIDKDLWYLTFVGGGNTLSQCKKLVNKLGLSSNIKFVGFKEDVSPYLVRNDVYILTSFYEGLPISIIEAMSYGLPIIASNVGGNSELVKNNVNGYLVQSQSDLEKYIWELIRKPTNVKSMGIKSSEIFNKYFTLDYNLRRINTVYKKLLNN